jgi:outer membrane protein assembly factor BamB
MGNTAKAPGILFVTISSRLYSFGLSTNTLKWMVDVNNASISSSPALSMDSKSVFVADGRRYLCSFSVAKGQFQWYFDILGSGTSPVVPNKSPFDFPVVYVGSTNGRVYAIKTSETEEEMKWMSNFLGDISASSSPAVSPDGTLVYLGVGVNRFLNKPGKVVALDASNGHVKWMIPFPNEIFTSSPAVDASGNVYIGSVGTSTANEDQARLYRITPDEAVSFFDGRPHGTLRRLSSPPAISASNSLVYVGSSDMKIYALSTADLAFKWSFPTTREVTQPVVLGADQTTVFAASDKLYQIDAVTGMEKVAPIGLPAPAHSPPIIGNDNSIFVGTATSGTSSTGEVFRFK